LAVDRLYDRSRNAPLPHYAFLIPLGVARK
jgi:hypothetical protein